MKNKDRLNEAINYENDYILDYFGFKVIYNYVIYIILIICMLSTLMIGLYVFVFLVLNPKFFS